MSNELDQLASLANSVKIDDELSAPKEWRTRGSNEAEFEVKEDEFHEYEDHDAESGFIDEALPYPPKKARRTPVDVTSRSLLTTIDGFTQLGRPWINSKFKKKIPDADWDRVYELQDEDNNNLTKADEKLLERVARLKKESMEFANQLQFSEQDYKDLMKSTELMVEETGFDMPPTLPFFLEIAKKLGERAIMISTI